MANTTLPKIKLALRISTNAFDDEITALIADAHTELQMLGVYDDTMEDDPQTLSAVIFYCKSRFGDNPDSDKWERMYRDKVEKLMIAADYGHREREAVNG